MRKKILSLLLVIAMVVSFVPGQAVAAENMMITVDSVTVTAGQKSVRVPVRVANAKPVAGLALQFDIPADITLTAVEKGEAIPAGPTFDQTPEAKYAGIDYNENFQCSEGILFTLVLDVSAEATGKLEISAYPSDNDEYSIVDETPTPVPVTFVPGTITVNGSTADRTVKFMNGTEEAATETIANGEKLTNIPAAPAAANGQSFLGWYAVQGTDYLLDNVEETITGTEASTQTAITADITYHAIWASNAMIAAGYMTTNGTTSITGISQSGNLQTLVTNCNGGTVKLLQDVILPNNTYLSVASGNTLTLDLNGKSLSGNGSVTQPGYFYVYKGVIDNAGTLSLVSTDVKKGTICLNDQDGRMTERDDAAIIKNNGSMPLLQNIKVEFSSTASAAEIYGFRNEDDWMNDKTSTIGVLSDCDFNTPNCNCAFYSSNDSGGTIGTIQNSSFTGKTTAVSLNQATVKGIQNCNLTATDGTALKLTSGTTVASLTGGDITGANGIQVENYYSNTATAFGVLAPTSVEGTNGYALVVGGTNTDNNKMTVNLTGGKYKGTEGALKLYTGATVTYPEGQKLLAGENGWSTLQTGYSVTFLNADGSLLQQITCASGSSVTYTGETPTRAADENYVYTFANKWNTAANGSGALYTGDTIENVTSDMTLYAQYTTASAKVVTVTIRGGAVGLAGDYASLKEAVTKLNASTGNYIDVVITLNEDTVETSTVEVKKSVTLDLNGHNLTADTAENGITVSNGATLTFKDSVGGGVFKHTATRPEKSAILANDSGTVVNIESGTIEATKGNGLKVNDAAFHVSGGTIIGGNNGIYVATQNASPVCTVSGGKIICSGNGFALNMDHAAIAGSIQLSGGAFKNTVNTTELIRKFDGQIKCAFQDSKSLSPSPNTEGFYEVREVGTYTLVLTADKKDYNYNAGETVTVTVSAYGPGSINSFGFTPSYDSGKLELKSVTSANKGNFTVNNSTGKSGYTVNGKNGITLGNKSDTATELVTITFTAKENINNTTTITLMDLEMTPSGSETSDKAVVEKELTVNLHDIRVTLTAANGTINGEKNVTLYAKYNEAGLYSDAARKAPATVDVFANEGHRLNDKQGESLWLCGDTGYASFDAIKGMTFTESKTFALQTTKVWTVSFDTNGVTGGSLSTKDPITVDDGTKLSAAGLPKPTPSTGYAFTGWTANNTMVDLNSTVTADITLTPVFTAQSYDFTKAANQSTVRVTAGVEAGKATYGQSVTFTVTPNNGYVVESVGYRIGDQATALTTLSPDQNGVYTIEGSKITGKVTVEVVTKAFYAVTFTVDSANTYTLVNGNKTFYAKEGTAGLYTDQTFTTRANAPAVTAADGYRLANELKNESLWYAGKTSYTTASLFGENATATFNSAVTIYAKTVQQCTITFDAGDHGTLADTATLIVDAGTKLEAVTKPTVTPDAGYAFDKWSVADDTVVIEDMTVTAMYKDGTYSISLPDSAIISVSEMTGISDANKVVHGTGVSFKLTVNHGYLVSSVSYKIGEGTATTVNKNADGTYTISIDGAAITGDIAVTVESQQTVDVAFDTDGNGSVAFAKKTVVKGSTLGADNVPTVTPNPGYQFEGWYKDSTKITNLANEKITSAVTYMAKFTHATYELALSAGLTLTDKNDQPITSATHDTDLTFTPTVDDKIVIGITAKIGETAVTVTKNADGSYTIAGHAIIGDLTITAQTVDGSWSFIGKGAYKALSADTQIALLTTGQLASGNYLLDNQGMYWSSKYNAYVKIVGVNETVESLTAKLSVSTNAEALTLAYTGDINGDGKATPADGGMINDELHEVTRGYNVTEKMRLEMDFDGNGFVSTADIMSILRKYVGLD